MYVVSLSRLAENPALTLPRATFLRDYTMAQSTFAPPFRSIKSPWLTSTLMQNYRGSSRHRITSKSSRACGQRKWQRTMRAMGAARRRLSCFLSCAIFLRAPSPYFCGSSSVFLSSRYVFLGHMLLILTGKCHIISPFLRAPGMGYIPLNQPVPLQKGHTSNDVTGLSESLS